MTPRRLILRDDAQSRWLCLGALSGSRECREPAQLPALLDWAEAQARAGRWVCGFVRYEAAPACDPALHPAEAPECGLPLAWFGASDSAETVADPGVAALEAVAAPALRAEIDAADYGRRFARVKDYLAAGDSYQVNLTFRLRGDFDGDPYALFCQLCANQAGRYAAYLEFDSHVVLSASPELFFVREGERIWARPMKGTTRRGADAEEDRHLAETLRADPKNQAENLMIVDMIRNDLGRVAEVGSVQVPQLFEIERYPRIQQMTTTVEARSKQSLSQLMAGLFPCASITGAPKARTVEIIAELEASPRELYTGSIGLLRPGGDCQFSVVIRTAVWERDSGEMSFGTGSGVVWDSTGADEHAECLLKANILEPPPPPGLFETLRWSAEAGYTLLDGHRARLAASAAALGIDFDPAAFDRLLAPAPELAPARVRVQLSADGQLSRAVAPAPEPRESMRVALCPWPVDSRWPLLRHKVDRRGLYERAQRDTAPAEQALLWNERGLLTEGCFANVVIREGERWITPPLDDGLLPGVLRGELLRQGQLQAESIPLARLRAADEVWLINALRGWTRAQLMA